LKWGLAAAALLAIVWAIYAKGDTAGYARGHAEAVTVQAHWDADRSRMQAAATTAKAQVAADKVAIAADREKVEHDAFTANEHRAASVAAADAGHRSLLDAAVHAARADSCGGPRGAGARAVTSGGDALAAAGVPGGAASHPGNAPDGGSAVVRVLGGSDETSGELAGFSGALIVGLLSCRAEYESLRTHNSLAAPAAPASEAAP
jgi:hypothetical protein